MLLLPGALAMAISTQDVVNLFHVLISGLLLFSLAAWLIYFCSVYLVPSCPRSPHFSTVSHSIAIYQQKALAGIIFAGFGEGGSFI